MNSNNLLLTVLAAGKFEIQGLANLVSGENPLACSSITILLCLYRVQEDEGLGLPFIRALIPFKEAPLS